MRRPPESAPPLLALLALLLAVLPPASSRADEPPGAPAPGRLAPRVPCAALPGTSYALYLPPGFTTERRWPVLLLLDARGRGAEAAGPFVPAAGRLGLVLASSNDSMSDGPLDPTLKALVGMLDDVRRRFAADDSRLLFGGFSGGARAAAFFANVAKLPVAGLLLAGAGLAEGQDPKTAKPVPVFATVGETDFNYYEVRHLGRALQARGVPARVAVFDGGHEWPPEPVAAEALAWLVRTAARIPGEEPGAGPTVPPSVRRREERERKELEDRLALLVKLVEGSGTESAARVARKLGVEELKRARSSASREERLFAERTLFALRVRASFYLPSELEAAGRPDRAALSRAVAAEIGPGAPAHPAPSGAPTPLP
ncbi:MAG: hypothetical protein EDX89_01445 [Acidobacteria bacterium]|nr:MAG: hypothetical protein EDX89_01445 [Acidobacteriota bacterium]